MSDSFKKGRFDTLSPTAGSLKKQLGSRVLIKAVNQAKIVVPEQFWTPFKVNPLSFANIACSSELLAAYQLTRYAWHLCAPRCRT